jgi:predicted dehydrogenase
MKILVLGCSSVFMRRVLPALDACHLVSDIYIASRSKVKGALDTLASDKVRGWFSDYNDCLKAVDADGSTLIYISLPNHLHFEWAKRALSSGYHVVVEKPAVLNLHDAQILVNIASSNNVCLAEAVVWSHHPQVQFVNQFIKFRDLTAKKIDSVFTVPNFEQDNFRSHFEFGGGAFNDMSAYAVSVGRVLFNSELKNCSGEIIATSKVSALNEVFSMRAYYTGGKILNGLFGFGLDYQNTVEISGDNFSVSLDRVFSPPVTEKLTVNERTDTGNKAHYFNGDAYHNFFTEVIHSIQAARQSQWAEILVSDHIIIEKLRKSIF